MKNYEIRDGKMTLDGKPVQLKFGDLDQIKVLRKFEKLSRELKEQGVDLEPTAKTIEFHFNCLCGVQRSVDVDADFGYEKHKCLHCEREYYIESDNYDNYKLYLIEK